MRFIFMLLVVAVTFIACSLDIQTSNVFHINVLDEKTGTNYDITCTTDIKYQNEAENKGVITDNKCTAFITTPDGTYKCDLAVGSDGKPITENTTISESCEMDIKK